MKNCTCFALLALTIALLTVGCETDDVGKFCSPQTASIGQNPVGGENPAVEVVRIHRDENCQSFQCLEHLGLSPHCTRSCAWLANTAACTADAQCPNQGKCLEGFCNEDDCPPGFACEAPLEAGELANQQVCVRRSDCNTNLDCEGLGAIDCVNLGCYDDCILNDACEMHQLRCEPIDSLTCTCPDGSDNCADSQLSCAPETSQSSLVEGSVSTRNVCIVRDSPQ